MLKKTKVMLVDDHAALRMGLAALLRSNREIDVVADVGDGASAVKEAERTHPDVVLMDLMMPGMDGVEATQKVLAACPETHVVILTTFGTADGICQAMSAGATGALLKSVDYDDLVAAILDAAKGRRVLTPELEQILDSEPILPKLTGRQREVLDSMTRGLTNQDIATQLGISMPSVRDHLQGIFDKLGAANRAEAVAIALRRHLLKA